MAEWSIAAVLKTVDLLKVRGFESLSLRQFTKYQGKMPEWLIGTAC